MTFREGFVNAARGDKRQIERMPNLWYNPGNCKGELPFSF